MNLWELQSKKLYFSKINRNQNIHMSTDKFITRSQFKFINFCVTNKQEKEFFVLFSLKQRKSTTTHLNACTIHYYYRQVMIVFIQCQ